jgi:hypothetical protein
MIKRISPFLWGFLLIAGCVSQTSSGKLISTNLANLGGTPDEALGGTAVPVQTQRLTDYYLYDVVWGNGQFVAVGSGSLNQTVVLTSPDGIRWSRVSVGRSQGPLGLSTGETGVLYGVGWNGSRFVAAGERLLTSTDGSNWMVAGTLPTCAFTRVAANGSMFVAVGGYYGRGCIATSTDGLTWSDRTDAIESNNAVLSGVIWTGSSFVALGTTGLGRFGVVSVFLTSRDGVSWSRQLATNTAFVDVAWNGTLFVAVGGIPNQQSGAIYTSPDGKTWTQSKHKVSYPFRSALWSGTQFVVTGLEGTIFTSSDGILWTEQVSGTTRDLLHSAWNNSRLVVVGRGTILSSTDGVVWQSADEAN